MWAIQNRTLYAVGKTWIRNASGAEVWIVAVKVTYDIVRNPKHPSDQGSVRVASVQPPINTGPMPYADSPSLCFETDLGPPKQATDVLLNGHAYSPNGQPMTELPAGWQLQWQGGLMQRFAAVRGNRYRQSHWLSLSKTSDPEPFIKMPLRWERAWGGLPVDQHKEPDPNPLGCGTRADAQGRVWLPNIESVHHPVTSPSYRGPPMAFGPIPSQWPQRRHYAGTYDEAWRRTRHPLLPSDFDARHHQVAPPEQQVPGHLKGGEAVVLVNLVPPAFGCGERLAFNLPKLSLAFETHFFDGSVQSSRSVIHSVILEPDFPRVSIVHHTHLPCHAKVNQLRHTVVREKSRPLDASSDTYPSDTHTGQATT
jgi:hypothetical protein